MLSPEQKFKALRALLRPIVTLVLRQALHFPEFVRIAKTVFLEVGEEELKRNGGKVNTSRLSVLTGLQRHEIIRLQESPQNPADTTRSVIGRVLGIWRYNRRFCKKPGTPRLLEFRGERSEFRRLVESVTTAINPGTVQYELERLGYVERTTKGLRLKANLQSFSGDFDGGLEIISKDIADLIKSGFENITVSMKGDWNLHIRTEYDNIAVDRVETVREWLLERGKDFHRKARMYLSQFDRDISPKEKDDRPGARIVITAFSAYELPPEDTEQGVK